MDRVAIGAAIRDRRQALGLSIRAAAERCGIHYSTLGQLEIGQTNATLDVLLQVAAGLSSDLIVSLAGVDGPPPASPIPDAPTSLPSAARQDVSELLSALTSPDESMASRARVGLELLVSGLKGGGR